MLILTIVGMVYDETFIFTGTTVTNETYTGGVNNTTIEIPSAGEQTFSINMSDTTLILAILIAGIGVAVVAGVNILGSGLSDTSQSVLFNSVVFLGLWAVLTVFSASMVFTNDLMILLYVIITIIFVIGLAMHISGSTGAGDGS